jgi:hypothetical protein
MNPDTHKRVKLKGGLEKTSSSAEVKADGSLVIELYDFSHEAEERLGNDVAFLLTISARDKMHLLTQLMAEQEVIPDLSDQDDLLLWLLRARFSDYYAVRQWLEKKGFPYQEAFDPWA